ncbi:ATP-dependent dethiobiotin synthetase BioD [Longispora fulva]|uniref:ATP-dependent dethiobiotin synthetase BioD n=1 Tax=Longispora fulva TaxID=619741 RepID=A0A8J7KXI9_9ACTN|nr:dethiobiotin synthase [Longispora fulva]MBG6137897.1 dethiobiotin synthetase [Longispora fulva]GIG60150.1 ATP-dependent dethiobiotin synthetase BioD [Longispora fulva]
MRTVLVTGTDTGVGKTIVTAALAAAAVARGERVVMVKPAQTGLTPGEESDAETVARLAGVRTVELVRYPDPLAPRTAARTSGLPELAMRTVVDAVADLDGDLVLIEGAGGLLVQLGEDGWTIADLAAALDAPLVVVARAGLGTLNHTALTLEAIARRSLTADVVIGSWPREPELAHRTNRDDLPPVTGVVPEGAGSLSPTAFRTAAPTWFTP